jgi:pentatricopeptide repeat protein
MHRANALLQLAVGLQVPPETAEGAACVRLGDVYSLVVDTYATQEEWAHALDILRDMQERDIRAEHFIAAATLRNIYQQNGIDVPSSAMAGAQGAGPHSRGAHGAFGGGSPSGAAPPI